MYICRKFAILFYSEEVQWLHTATVTKITKLIFHLCFRFAFGVNKRRVICRSETCFAIRANCNKTTVAIGSSCLSWFLVGVHTLLNC